MSTKQRTALTALLALTLVVAVPASSALVAPVLTGPDEGVTVSELPPFKWDAVTGADRYEFEFAADPGFNGATIVSTKNTRAALKLLVPNGTYYWRVRGVTSGGDVGAWSDVRSLDVAWTAQAALLAPSNGATITYPDHALELKWGAVQGAAKYLVKVASDPGLGTLVFGEPIETASTQFTLNDPMPPGTYYWGITPLNAQGHEGNPSTVASFIWTWPSTSTPTYTDLASEPELVDPRFSWTPVLGAAGYQVEVNFSSDWAAGSKVCCDAISFHTQASTLGTSLSPAIVLANNTYFWRVRAIDSEDNAGVWNVGPSFTKTFDNVPPVAAPSIKNVHMRDNAGDPAVDTDTGTAVVDTDVPVVAWDPVIGASGYTVNVTGFSGGVCDWASATWDTDTSVHAWTPLGWSRVSGSPYPPWNPSTDSNRALTADAEYCVRVRAYDRPSINAAPINGDWTYLPANNQPAFKWNGPPATAACGPPCTMTSGDYNGPVTGTTVGTMPLFTWDPLLGAESYYILVARDPSFTNVIDFAFTRIPAYAPRTSSGSVGYADETTLYYWAVLPADNANGSGVSADPLTSGPQNFEKQSAPTDLVAPVGGAVVNAPATVFEWDAVHDARRYRLQVAVDPTFGTLIDDVETDASSYTSNTTYPSDTTLYWRVRADAEDDSGAVGLSWSESGTFTKQLPKPVWDPDNPTTGAFLPTIKWSTVPGAVSYDLHVVEPDGQARDFRNIPAPAGTFIEMTGVGVFTWTVRANFPTDGLSTVDGPYSLPSTFTHTIPEPSGTTEEVGVRRLLLQWDPRPRADDYRVQVSTRADFATITESTTTQTTAHASLLTAGAYTTGGSFFWRVAMVDADGNVGDYSVARPFTLPPLGGGGSGGGPTTQRFRGSFTGYPVRNEVRTVTLTVRNGSFQLVAGANVRISGAGVRAVTKKTGTGGKVSFRLRATRFPGSVSFRVTKAGFTAATYRRSVRAG